MALIEIIAQRPLRAEPSLLAPSLLVPTKADLTLSGQRDASELKVVFERANEFDLGDLTQTVEVVYGREGAPKRPLYRWGAANSTVSVQQGRRTVEATLTIGPYRYAQETRRASAWLLYDELIRGDALIRRIVDSIAVETQVDFEGDTTFDWAGSSETARWIYLLNNISLAPVLAAERGAPGPVQPLIERIYAYLAGEYLFDDAVRMLYDHFGLLTYVDYAYSDGLATLGPNPGSATLNAQLNPPPPLHFRAVHDAIPDDAPAYVSKRFTHALDLSVLPQEETLCEFIYDADGDTALSGQGLLPNSRHWLQYRTRASLNNIVADPFGAAVSDQARQVLGIVENVRAAWLECHLTQRQLFLGNRTCQATIRAPDTAEQVKALRPGNPVLIDGRGYWITELALDADDEEARLSLVDPQALTNDNYQAWLREVAAL